MTTVPPLFWVLVCTALGAIFGSYINMAAYRLPRGISTWKRTRSFCPKCQHGLAWYDNIPILSYLVLLGRCHYCRAPIGTRYLVTELLAAALFTLAALQFFVLNGGPGGAMPLPLFCALLFLSVDFLLLSVVDWEVYLIPLETTLWWIPAALAAGMFFPALHASMTIWTRLAWFNALIDSFTGMVVGAGLLWSVGFLVAVLFFIRNTLRGIQQAPPEAMGMGDVHMLALFGALFGWKPALMAVLSGVLLGAFVGVGKLCWDKIQRARRGKNWHPKPPTFELPEDGEPYEPQLWMPACFGAIVLLAAVLLQDQRGKLVAGHSYNHFVPVLLLFLFGTLLLAASPFYYFLRKRGLLPGGEILENAEGVKEEVYLGNYIPFGPSLAAGALFVTFADPLLRAFAYKFFIDPESVPTWSSKILAEQHIAAFLHGILDIFNAFSQWLLAAKK